MQRTPLAVALTLGLLLASGCGADPSRDSSAEERQRPRATPSATPSSPPSAEPSEHTRPSKPTSKSSRRPVAPRVPAPEPSDNALVLGSPGAADAHLIGAAALGDAWSVARTAGEGDRMTSRCQRATLHDIGAEATRVRDFAAADAVAVQAVSRFVDPKSAWRAERVVAAWNEDCTRALTRRDAALGTVRHGVWLSMVEVAGVKAPKQRLRAALGAVEKTF